MTKTACFSGCCFLQGNTYEVDSVIGTALVAYESAVLVDLEPLAKKRQKAIKGHYETR